MRNPAFIFNNLFTCMFHPSIHAKWFSEFACTPVRKKKDQIEYVYVWLFFSIALCFSVFILPKYCFSEVLRVDLFLPWSSVMAYVCNLASFIWHSPYSILEYSSIPFVSLFLISILYSSLFVLCGSIDFDEHTVTCQSPQYRAVQFHHPQNVLTLSLCSQSSCISKRWSPLICFLSLCFAFSRISCRCNHTIFSHLGLPPFTYKMHLRFIHDSAWINNSFLFIG